MGYIESLIEVWWHIYLSIDYVISGSDNGLEQSMQQAIDWNDEALSLVGTH